MWYPVRTPAVFRWVYSSCLWQKSKAEPVVYLSFDDGPHPEVTHFVLDELKKWQAKATFFCIGENVERYPEVFARIKEEGHSVGNHTQCHVNGWKTDDDTYIQDVKKAGEMISSKLFRPPYGRIRFSQVRKLKKETDLQVVMWSLLSGDFDNHITPEQCAKNVLDNIQNGDVVVFHDSIKAKKNIEFALPLVLAFLHKNGFVCKAI